MKYWYDMTLSEVESLLGSKVNLIMDCLSYEIQDKQNEIKDYKVQETRKLISQKPNPEKEKRITGFSESEFAKLAE